MSPSPSAPPRRILIFLDNPGNLRHFQEPIRLLADAGHQLELAFGAAARDDAETALLERLRADNPSIRVSTAPRRSDRDGWRPTSTVLRAAADFARYLHPRYADAPALRARAATIMLDPRRPGRPRPETGILARVVDALSRATSSSGSRIALRVLAACETALPTSRRLDRFIVSKNPDAVVVAPMVQFGSPQADAVKSAKRAGIPTGVWIASWDNLTTKGLLRVVPDRVLVWNETQRDELEALHGIDRERAVLTGAPRFDEWFARRPTRTRASLLLRIGLDPDVPYVLYTCSSSFRAFVAADELDFVWRWLAALRSDNRFAPDRLGVLVRPHPQNAAPWDEVDPAGFGNAVVWPRGGSHPDAGDARADFFDSIHFSEAVVGINTTAMLEAAIVGKPVLTWIDEAYAGIQEGTLHFRHLLRENGGFLRVARSEGEHLEQLADAVAAGAGESERLKRFVTSFVRPGTHATAAAPTAAAAIADLAQLPRRPPESVTAPALLLRSVLLGLATAARLVAVAQAVLRARRPPRTAERA